MSGHVSVAVDGPVARIALANPRKRNALTFAMYDQLTDACDRLAREPALRVVVLTGAGTGAFAAGTDIAELADVRDAASGVDYERRTAAVLSRLGALDLAVIAAVRGPAVGAGLALALVCDVVVCTPDAVFGAPVARTLGNCLSPQVVGRLYAAIGRSRARALLMKGETVAADDALAIGLVDEVVPSGDFDLRVAELATRLAGLAPLTLASLKEVDRRLMRALAALPAEDVYASVYGSRDFREGVVAFLDRRPPSWTGR